MDNTKTWLLISLDASYFIGELVLGALVWAACFAFPEDSWRHHIMHQSAFVTIIVIAGTLIRCIASLEARYTFHRELPVRIFHLTVGCAYLVSGTAGISNGPQFTAMMAQACAAFHLSHFFTFLTCSRRIDQRIRHLYLQ
ncbi:uncharacterized protein LOC144130274 [Amblyomma americanum]